MDELTSTISSGSTLSSTETLREMSRELNGMLSHQPLDKSTSGKRSFSPTPTFYHYSSEATGSAGSVARRSRLETVAKEQQTNDRASLEQQIQAHAQTVQMLVLEKTALQAQVQKLQTELADGKKARKTLKDDLQSCQQRLQMIERERGQLDLNRSQQEQELKSSSQQLTQVQHNLQQTRYALDESKQENAEMTSKLTVQAAELLQVQTANAELQAKLGMAELLTQQLSEGASSTSEVGPADEQLQRISADLEQTKSTVQRVTVERDRALTEVTQLTNSLREQQQQYNEQCVILQQQCEEHQERYKLATETIARFEAEKDASVVDSTAQLSQYQETSQIQLRQLQDEILQLKDQLHRQAQDNSQLSRLNAEQESLVAELEGQLARLREQSVDHHQLLDTMTSDKETISRTTLQNNELKRQLEELQDGFVKLSHQSMELTSGLQSEQHNSKQLRELYQQQLDANQLLSQQLASVQSEMDSVRKESNDDSDSVGDLLKDKSEGLTFALPPAVSHSPVMLSDQEDLLQQVQAERDALASRLDTLTEEHARVCQSQLERHGNQSQREEGALSFEAGDTVSSTEQPNEGEQLLSYSQLQTNFSALQGHFTLLINKKAELLDRLQQYEHLNVQLAGETETIGEYITLYHNQRDSLKKKSEVKDRFITQLMREKETLQGKFTELQDLVTRLVSEQQIPSPNFVTATALPHDAEKETSECPAEESIDGASDIVTTPEALQPVIPEHVDATDIGHRQTDTANQILTLLHEIESTSHAHHQLIIPCHCCVGELISV